MLKIDTSDLWKKWLDFISNFSLNTINIFFGKRYFRAGQESLIQQEKEMRYMYEHTVYGTIEV